MEPPHILLVPFYSHCPLPTPAPCQPLICYLSKYLVVGWLAPMVGVCVNFSEIAKLSSKVAVSFCIPTSEMWDYSWFACQHLILLVCLPTHLPTYLYLVSHSSDRYSLISHCGFDLHFPGDQWHRGASVFFLHVSSLVKYLSKIFPFKKCVLCFLTGDFQWLLCILHMSLLTVVCFPNILPVCSLSSHSFNNAFYRLEVFSSLGYDSFSQSVCFSSFFRIRR